MKYTNGGKDKENVNYMRYVKSKAKRIENLAKLKDKKENPKKYKKENEKLFENILGNLKVKPAKTALLTEDQKKDPKIIEVPFGPSFKEEIEKYEKEKEQNNDEAYKIRLPRSPINKLQYRYSHLCILIDHFESGVY